MTANEASYPQAVQFDLFRRLIPALISASQLHARFEQLRDTIKYQSAVMDNGIYPVWLVDRAGKMLYASTGPNITSARTTERSGLSALTP